VAVKAVFLDVGETIVNESRAWAQIARHCGIEPHVMWAGIGAIIERGEGHRKAFELLGVEQPNLDGGWEAVDFYSDARPCLEALKEAGYFVGLAGNIGHDPGPFLSRHFEVDFVASSHTLGASKPARKFFELLIEAGGADPGETAYVGDRLDNDVLPASEAGMISVFVRRGPWGYLQSRLPEADRATIRIDSLAELTDALAHV
jgi:FMN phosphatase YigB (HAD superfamily)